MATPSLELWFRLEQDDDFTHELHVSKDNRSLLSLKKQIFSELGIVNGALSFLNKKGETLVLRNQMKLSEISEGLFITTLHFSF